MRTVNPQLCNVQMTFLDEVARPPSRSRSDVRRAAILEIAREVFLSRGYADASMSAIAARLGGSKGTLYNYFKSKEELFAAFMREACMNEAEHAFDFGDYEGDLAAGLRQLGERFLRFVLSDTVAAVHRLVISEGVRFPELGRTFYEIGPREGVDRLAVFLHREMLADRVLVADPHRAAEQFLDLVKGGLHQRRLWGVIDAPSDADIAANVEAAVEVWMRAYAA